MRTRTKLALALLFVAVASSTSFFSFKYYGFVFGPVVRGEIVSIECLGPTPIPDGTPMRLQSYDVAIKLPDGEIYTATTIDRQWALVAKGSCVRAKLFIYPPWDMEKGGTFYGARLKEIYNCQTSKG